MTNGDQQPYKPGDIVNEHVLTADGRWVPLAAASPPGGGPPPPPANYAYGQQWAPQPMVYVQADNSNNTSLAPATSLISGLVGLSVCWIPVLGIIGWLLGPIAIIFGGLGLGRGKAEHKIMSWIGIVCGFLTLVICIVWAVAFTSAINDA